MTAQTKTYDEILCPACFDDPALDAALAQNAAEYAQSLPEHICADEDEYALRLAACRACPHLSRGVCVKCGCFVIVRARRKNRGCPLAAEGASRW